MTTVIRLKQINPLSVFISFILFIFIQSTAASDSDKDDKTISIRTELADETNQTQTIVETKLPSNEAVGLDTTFSAKPVESSPSNENLVTAINNNSNISQEATTTTPSPAFVDENETLSSTPPLTKKNQSNINSFEEWKRQQLQADGSKEKKERTGDGNDGLTSPDSLSASLSKGTGISSNPNQIPSNGNSNSGKKGKLRKNFASASCGAKILAHNAEAQNTGSILSSSPDEYMLNPCNAKIWFVIELCESIRILNIEIANFELFSSVPKTFRVFASDRYPTKDWHRYNLGTFNVSYSRIVQSFQPTEISTYVKYLKFELLDFHGHEHYCPLSVVRIHGSNVEDEIMTMEENTNAIKFQSSLLNPDEVGNEEGENTNLPTEQVGGMIGSAILDLAKRVFRRPTTRNTAAPTTPPMPESTFLKVDCARSTLHSSIKRSRLTTWRRSDSFKRCIARFLHGLWPKIDSCTNYLSQICFLSNYCCQCSLYSQMLTRRKSTTNIYRHYCGYYHLLTNHLVCKKVKRVRFNETLPQRATSVNGEIVQDINEKNRTSNEHNLTKLNDSSGSNLTSIQINENSLSIDEFSLNDSTSLNNTSNDVDLLHSLNTTHFNATRTVSTLESSKTELNITETSIETPMNPNHDLLTTTVASSMNQQEPFPTSIYTQWLKGMLINTKSLPELFKIIEKLNFNLTLSNRYLQELSEHYVKKLDETQQTTDLLLKASKEADMKFKHYEEQLSKLQKNLDELSFRLIKLEVWIPLTVFALVASFCSCLWSTCRLIQYRHQIDSFRILKKEKQLESSDNEVDEGQNRPMRSNQNSKRKLSTDSNDSNVSRSQRVPDLPLSKIRENGHHHSKLSRRKSSSRTNHLFSLSTVQT